MQIQNSGHDRTCTRIRTRARKKINLGSQNEFMPNFVGASTASLSTHRNEPGDEIGDALYIFIFNIEGVASYVSNYFSLALENIKCFCYVEYKNIKGVPQ